MKINSLLIGVLALASIALAGGKTYSITISKAAKAGTVDLAPGQYQLKVDGSTAVFTDSHHKSFSTAIKVETTAKKNQYTAVDSSEGAAKDLIHSITLAGSTTKVEFEPVSSGN
jgi:ABC-type phosphate transport system substrate-binding protein